MLRPGELIQAISRTHLSSRGTGRRMQLPRLMQAVYFEVRNRRDYYWRQCAKTLGVNPESIDMVKLGFHAVAVLYTGGSVAQLLKLVYNFPWQEMPFFIDWLIVILGLIGVTTLLTQTRNIAYRGRWEKPVHFLIIFHLGVSVVLHLWTIYAQNHDLYAMFPLEYSYFALVYFVFFAWRSWTIRTV